jgi:hypothetical protein
VLAVSSRTCHPQLGFPGMPCSGSHYSRLHSVRLAPVLTHKCVDFRWCARARSNACPAGNTCCLTSTGTAGCTPSDYMHCGPKCLGCGRARALSWSTRHDDGGCYQESDDGQTDRFGPNSHFGGYRVISLCSSETDVMNGRCWDSGELLANPALVGICSASASTGNVMPSGLCFIQGSDYGTGGVTDNGLCSGSFQMVEPPYSDGNDGTPWRICCSAI